MRGRAQVLEPSDDGELAKEIANGEGTGAAATRTSVRGYYEEMGKLRVRLTESRTRTRPWAS